MAVISLFAEMVVVDFLEGRAQRGPYAKTDRELHLEAVVAGVTIGTNDNRHLNNKCFPGYICSYWIRDAFW